MHRTYLSLVFAFLCIASFAQKVQTYATTETKMWQVGKTSLSSKPTKQSVLVIDGKEKGVPFKAWGTTFNELDWDAFNLLTRQEQDEVRS